MSNCVEEVSSSLVREYLSRKGLKKTIACMDEERPRTMASINNRSHLRQILSLETLYKKNKIEKSPCKTLLEIIVKHMIETATNEVNSPFVSSPIELNNFESSTTSRRIRYVTNNCFCFFVIVMYEKDVWKLFTVELNSQGSLFSLRSHLEETKPSQTTLLLPDKPEKAPHNQSSLTAHDQKGQALMASQDNEHFRVPVTESTKRNKTSRIRRGMMPGPIASSPEVPNVLVTLTNCISNGNCLSLCCAFPPTLGTQSAFKINHYIFFMLVVSFDSVFDSYNVWLQELKLALLGSSLNCFSVEWKNQGFIFSETHDLGYGIVQKKGGPCGVLASVQAFVLKKLLKLRPSNNSRRKCLARAIAEILWRAGEEKQVIVAISTKTKHFIPAAQYKSEGILERIMLFTLDNHKDLELFLDQHIEQFESEILGCLLLVISAILSRSIEKVREDMDVPTTTLIGAHGYCTQELVNLLLCGQAVSNVFDHDMELDSGNGNITLLKGVKDHCEIGFLSLFEHYNICKVGSYLKTPHFPIWVVCSESHFSVLFGLQRELLTYPENDLEFDLYYYDGLSHQQEEIRLTVCKFNHHEGLEQNLIPPLEHCIRTRLVQPLFIYVNIESLAHIFDSLLCF
uniref:Ubiquitin carboxyl-terminal hydrolase MINDY n=1 Tax=Neogobius melanostomus TaxID=47308 RepID=A0A8C6U2U5_9GOBI